MLLKILFPILSKERRPMDWTAQTKLSNDSTSQTASQPLSKRLSIKSINLLCNLLLWTRPNRLVVASCGVKRFLFHSRGYPDTREIWIESTWILFFRIYAKKKSYEKERELWEIFFSFTIYLLNLKRLSIFSWHSHTLMTIFWFISW